jgi:signal transduction histidine kinase
MIASEIARIEAAMSLTGPPAAETHPVTAPSPAICRQSRSGCAAVGDDRDRIARRLNDDIIRGLFGIGLRLQATAQLADGAMRARLDSSIQDLDLTIAEVRGAIFDLPRPLTVSIDDLEIA